jgi:hypothetical protein
MILDHLINCLKKYSYAANRLELSTPFQEKGEVVDKVKNK